MVDIDRLISVNVFRYCISAIAILSNAFIIFLVLKHRSLRQSQCNMLIAKLALWEMMIGVSIGIRATYALHSIAVDKRDFDRFTCALLNSSMGCSIHLQHTIVVVIALNQLLVTIWPLRYRNEFGEFYLAPLLLVELLVIAFVEYSTLFDIDRSKRTTQCTMAASGGPHLRYTHMLFNTTLITMLVLYSLTLLIFICSAHSGSLQNSVQRRVTNGLLLVLCNYTICWSIFPIISFLAKCFNDTQLSNMSTIAAGFMAGVNASMSFFIYMLKHEELRRCARRTLSRCGKSTLFTVKSTNARSKSDVFPSSHVRRTNTWLMNH